MAAKFIESNLTDKKAILRITTRDDAVSMKTLDNGTTINLVAYVVQEITKDFDGDGEIFQSILVLDTEGRLYATRSETFIRKIHVIIDIFRDPETGEIPDLTADPVPIRITRQIARSGREFVSCSYA